MRFHKTNYILQNFSGITLNFCEIEKYFVDIRFHFWYFQNMTAKFQFLLNRFEISKLRTWQRQKLKKSILQLPNIYIFIALITTYVGFVRLEEAESRSVCLMFASMAGAYPSGANSRFHHHVAKNPESWSVGLMFASMARAYPSGVNAMFHLRVDRLPSTYIRCVFKSRKLECCRMFVSIARAYPSEADSIFHLSVDNFSNIRIG